MANPQFTRVITVADDNDTVTVKIRPDDNSYVELVVEGDEPLRLSPLEAHDLSFALKRASQMSAMNQQVAERTLRDPLRGGLLT